MSSEPSAVSASLLYFKPPADGSRPYNSINTNPVTGKRDRNWTQEPHVVEIENLRSKEHTVSLDTAGFQFVTHESEHKAFTQRQQRGDGSAHEPQRIPPSGRRVLARRASASLGCLQSDPDCYGVSLSKAKPLSFRVSL